MKYLKLIQEVNESIKFKIHFANALISISKFSKKKVAFIKHAK